MQFYSPEIYWQSRVTIFIDDITKWRKWIHILQSITFNIYDNLLYIKEGSSTYVTYTYLYIYLVVMFYALRRPRFCKTVFSNFRSIPSLRYDYRWSETQLITDKWKRTKLPRKLNDVEFKNKRWKDYKLLYLCDI